MMMMMISISISIINDVRISVESSVAGISPSFFCVCCYNYCLLVINVVIKKAAVWDDADITCADTTAGKHMLGITGEYIPNWDVTWCGPHPSPLVPVCGLMTSREDARRVARLAVRSITASSAMCLPLDIFILYVNTDPVEPVIIHQEVSPNGNCLCPAHSLFISMDGAGSAGLL